MRDIRVSAEVADLIGAEHLDRLRHDPAHGPFTCWHCESRGDADTEPAAVIVARHDGGLTIGLAHADCMGSRVVGPDAETAAQPDVRTLTDEMPGPDGPLPLLILDFRPGLAVRADPPEPADPFYATLLDMGLTPVTTISDPPGAALLTQPPAPAPGWRLDLTGPRTARLTAPDGTIVYDGTCGGQARPWRAQIIRTGRCVVLVGAVGLYPREGERPFTWIETLLDRAAHATELAGGLVAASC